MDYLKSVVPSHLLSERGSNLVVINPGSANIKIGLASKDTPLNIPIALRGTPHEHGRNVRDQLLNAQVMTAQYMDRQRAYDMMGRIDGLIRIIVERTQHLIGQMYMKKEPSQSSALGRSSLGMDYQQHVLLKAISSLKPFF